MPGFVLEPKHLATLNKTDLLKTKDVLCESQKCCMFEGRDHKAMSHTEIVIG